MSVFQQFIEIYLKKIIALRAIIPQLKQNWIRLVNARKRSTCIYPFEIIMNQ